MQIFPVLDIQDSIVVRGVAGEREKYLPVESCIATSSEPLDVAKAFRSEFGLKTLYLADLDAIQHGEPNYELYGRLNEAGFELLIDAGIRNAFDAEAALMAGAAKVVIGLETWPLLSTLEMLTHQIGPERLIFSLDLKNGELIKSFPDVMSDDPVDIGASVIEAGIRELIVLDLAAVGTGSGLATLETCQELRDFAPRISLITGGGVRSADDLAAVAEAGVDGVLIASALHDGSIGRDQISR